MRLIDLDSEYIQETLYRRSFKTRQDIEEWLNNAPTIDAVPVTRCKDCAHKERATVNEKGFLICPASGMEIAPDDFCSYGEPKEGADG